MCGWGAGVTGARMCIFCSGGGSIIASLHPHLPTHFTVTPPHPCSQLTVPTIRALYEYVFGAPPPTAAARPAPTHMSTGSGFQLAEDSDYEPEDEEEY
jgi:hypothetical protein